MKKRYLLASLVIFLFLFSCVDGSYDPEGRWELNAKDADACEPNDSFAAAFEASPVDLLYLNFYDDIIDYYICSFAAGCKYTLKADVPFDHLSDTTITVFTYEASPKQAAVSVAPSDDNRDSVITGFSAEAGNYYVLVTNTLSSGTGELRGYTLTIEKE